VSNGTRTSLGSDGYVIDVSDGARTALSSDRYVIDDSLSVKTGHANDGYGAFSSTSMPTYWTDGNVTDDIASVVAPAESGNCAAANSASEKLALDSDRYVADSCASSKPKLDCDGYIADDFASFNPRLGFDCRADNASALEKSTRGAGMHGAAAVHAVLDAQKTVQSADALSGIASRAARKSSVSLRFGGSESGAAVFLVDRTRTAPQLQALTSAMAAQPGSVRAGIAARKVRKQSLYLGFNSTNTDADETRL
jgi:hypothetical protein